ncbi:MAG: DedA family protein [Pirellulales bacterium]|nr:DedA family protein [Pirellulales bacterium]
MIDSGGYYLGIFLLLVLTGCGMPIPEEVFIILAGVLSSQGQMAPEWAVAACLSGALVGDAVMYSIGYHFGHGLLAQHPKLGKFVGAQREEQFEQAIQRHGFKVMLLARFMVGVRGPVYLAAGVVRMPFRRFVLWDLTCASLVVGSFFGLSYLWGEEITNVLQDAEKTFTLIVLVVGLSVLLWWMRRRRKSLIDKITDVGAEDGPLATDATDVAKNNRKQSEDVA